MQSACSGGTGTFIEKTARKLQMPAEALAQMAYAGMSLHKISSKCGIFAEADANTLVKSGVPVEEIIASLFEAVVYQNLATLTKGNTPMPEVLLLGGPNLFFKGLQEAWRHHLGKLWTQRQVALPDGRDPASLIIVPDGGALLRLPRLRRDRQGRGTRRRHLPGTREARAGGSRRASTNRRRRRARKGLIRTQDDLADVRRAVGRAGRRRRSRRRGAAPRRAPVLVGCDFGSTTAKAVVLSPTRELLFSCYVLSKGNPIEDAKALFRQIREAGLRGRRRRSP